MTATTSLRITRIIRAPRARVFHAWTSPEQLTKWWGPAGVSCPEAHVDLREGGAYRIANRYSDGRIVWISGMFERIRPPDLLVYTWRVDAEPQAATLVTLDLRDHPSGTELVLLHERIAHPALGDGHLTGWNGCLDRLDTFLGK